MDAVSIGIEIATGTIKWVYTNPEHENIVIAQKNHKYLASGEMDISNTYITRHKYTNAIQNGFLHKDTDKNQHPP